MLEHRAAARDLIPEAVWDLPPDEQGVFLAAYRREFLQSGNGGAACVKGWDGVGRLRLQKKQRVVRTALRAKDEKLREQDEREASDAREVLLDVARAWADSRAIPLGQALSEMGRARPDLVDALGYGPPRANARSGKRLSEPDPDPRGELAAKATKLASEKKIPFDVALEEVKAAVPALVEQVAELYGRTE